MGIFINILVILIAVIAFLILYYLTLDKDRKNQDYKLPFKKAKTNYEFGEELGVDLKKMDKISSKSNLKESSISLRNESSSIVHHQEEYMLKDKYGKEFIRLFIRDPEYLFTYWEVNKNEYYENEPCLRLHNEDDNNIKDIRIGPDLNNWYIHVEPNKSYRVTIGYKINNIFYSIASSRVVRTPRNRPSDYIDEHWMTIEELSAYSFRIEMDTLSMIKNIEGRKIEEELEADSFTLLKK
ncbi:MAG: DUF4912 domain-containing protein [Bacillota bacterium]